MRQFLQVLVLSSEGDNDSKEDTKEVSSQMDSTLSAGLTPFTESYDHHVIMPSGSFLTSYVDDDQSIPRLILSREARTKTKKDDCYMSAAHAPNHFSI